MKILHVALPLFFIGMLLSFSYALMMASRGDWVYLAISIVGLITFFIAIWPIRKQLLSDLL
jgi:hypothetical protein